MPLLVLMQLPEISSLLEHTHLYYPRFRFPTPLHDQGAGTCVPPCSEGLAHCLACKQCSLKVC